MNELALFAGAGGGILGSHLLGWRTVAAVEIEEYPRAVLLQRQADGILPRFPIWDDVRTFDGNPWRGRVDIITGGFPCQPFSSAARGRNNAWDGWPEMLRIVGEVRPRYVLAENVQQKPIARAAGDLEAIGYRTEFCSIAAHEIGLDHQRNRWWLLAYPDRESELQRNIHAKVAWVQGLRENIREWQSETMARGNEDGFDHRVDRLKAIGNGQVPAVVVLAWETLSKGLT